MWLRIDSIEQAIRTSGIADAVDAAGYLVGHAVANDNLRLGRDVVADCVNPWMPTRDLWRAIGMEAGATVAEIEVICSDPAIHRHRVETRVGDVPGLVLPGWARIAAIDYHPWDRDRLIIDTAGRTSDACVAQAIAAL